MLYSRTQVATKTPKGDQRNNFISVTNRERRKLIKVISVLRSLSKASPRLDQLFDGLCSVQLTSTQSERNVALAGGFVSKLRIRPTDNHVDASRFTLSTKITPRNKKKFQYFTVHSNISRVLVFRTRISRFLIFPFPGNLKMTTDKATPAAEA